MNEPRDHLPRDLKALRYLDALNAGDLEAVSALWEEASHDPELEGMLVEIDGAMFQEIPGNPSSLPERPGRPRRRWAVRIGAVGTLSAACLLAILAWPWHDTKDQGPSPHGGRAVEVVAHQPSDASRDFTTLLGVRRDLDEAAMPGFVWPLENPSAASTARDRLD